MGIWMMIDYECDDCYDVEEVYRDSFSPVFDERQHLPEGWVIKESGNIYCSNCKVKHEEEK